MMPHLSQVSHSDAQSDIFNIHFKSTGATNYTKFYIIVVIVAI